MSRSLHRRVFGIVAGVTIVIVGVLIPAPSASVTVEAEPVLPELDQLPNRDQPISLKLDRLTAANALNAIAAAGNFRAVMEGSTDCCRVDLYLIDVPVRRALELLAAQTDARYQVVTPDTLRVWLPEMFLPGSENGVTPPVILNRAEPVYPEDARAARAEGTVIVMAVVRYDGTVSHATVHKHADGWPSLDEAALASVRRRTYRPAMKNGEPVSLYFVIRVDFRLS